MSRCWRPWKSNAQYAEFRRKYGEKAARQSGLGQAISYRFKRDGKGWRVFVTTDVMDSASGNGPKARGAIGVDLNADHLAVSETDAERQLAEVLAGAVGHLREVPTSGASPDW